MSFTTEPRWSGATSAPIGLPASCPPGKSAPAILSPSFNRTLWEGSSYMYHNYILRHGVTSVPQSCSGLAIPGTRSRRCAAAEWPQFLRPRVVGRIRLFGRNEGRFHLLVRLRGRSRIGMHGDAIRHHVRWLAHVHTRFPLGVLVNHFAINHHAASGAVEGAGFGCWADARPDSRTRKPVKIITPNRLTLDCCFIHLSPHTHLIGRSGRSALTGACPDYFTRRGDRPLPR